MSFVHLHTHSEYSLLDGANRIPDLIARIKALGMDSLALTDHGNIFGAWTFYEQARAAGIRPILGFEAYVAFGSRHLREKVEGAPANYAHLVLLAKKQGRLPEPGPPHVARLRPRATTAARASITRRWRSTRKGWSVSPPAWSGEVALWLRQGRYDTAKETAAWHAKLFGEGNYWLEVQDHGLSRREDRARGDAEDRPGARHWRRRHQRRPLPGARRPPPPTDVLLAIGTGKDLSDPKRFRFDGTESYVKTEDEMRRALSGA